jgi:hypothetical protein
LADFEEDRGTSQSGNERGSWYKGGAGESRIEKRRKERGG